MEKPILKPKNIRDEPAPAAAPAAGGGGGGGAEGGVGALRQQIEIEDHRLKGAAFFLFCGGSVIVYGTVLNRSANPEHVFAGFGMFTAGAALALLTLAGAGAGRAAARVEEALRGFF